MTNVIRRISEWFAKAKPTPSLNDLNTQLGCHFEEVAEMVNQLAALDNETGNMLEDLEAHLVKVGEHLKKSPDAVRIPEANRALFLDGVCDQIVTATGCAVYAEMNIVDGLNEVSESNWSKFDAEGNPILDANGKIMKGPFYFEPQLSRFV